MTENLVIIITVVVLSFGIMLVAARYIFSFVNKHPTVKMLALAFLLLIGVFLIADGFGVKIDKALIYMPMAFAILVEALNLTAAARRARRLKTSSDPVRLHTGYPVENEEEAVHAATSKGPDAGAVHLSRKPVHGVPDATDGHEEPRGLG